MSFTKDAKAEILARSSEWVSAPVQLAHIYGIVCFAKSFDASALVLHTDMLTLAVHLKSMLQIFGIDASVQKRTGGYECVVRDEVQMKELFSLLNLNERDTSLRLKTENTEVPEDFQAFLAGCFLAGGLISNPAKEYMLEFLTPRFNFASDFAALLAQKGFEPKRTTRKSQHIIYFKASEQVEDLLITMGATGASFEVMNHKIIKDIRNNANRITNCETANIEKTVAATRRYLEYISFLQQRGAFETLPEEVRQVALLRRENPAATLAELGEMCTPPVGKSGVSYRLRKIESTAKNLQEKEQNG